MSEVAVAGDHRCIELAADRSDQRVGPVQVRPPGAISSAITPAVTAIRSSTG